jgi:hypothetical protein
VRTAQTEITGRADVSELRTRPDQSEVRAARQRPRSQVHEGDMRDIAVGENDLLNIFSSYQFFQFFFRENRYALGVERPAQRWGIAT